MATPERQKTGIQTTPRRSPFGGSPRTPQSPQYVVLPPTGKVNYKYASGVLPITYTQNESTKAMEWKILLCIEFRSREERRCIHPLAGKKETFDEDDPVKTAVREFTEETNGVYKDFDTESEIRANLREGDTSWIYVMSSRMYFFYVYVPYKPNVQELFTKTTEKTCNGDELFWYPLHDFIANNGRISYLWNNQKVLPSKCCQDWFNNKAFRDGFETAKLGLLKRLEMHGTPLAPSISPSKPDELVNSLAATLASTSLDAETKATDPASSDPIVLSSAPLASTSSTVPASD